MVQKLADLQVGMDFELPVLINQVNVRTAKNGRRFLDLIFSDASQELPGKYWDASEADVQTFVVGKVVFLTGKCETYQGKLQIKITKMERTADSQYEINQFVPHGPLTKTQLQEQIKALLLEITVPKWNRMVRYLLKQHQTAFYEFPAAKSNHHDYAGGLAFHTLSIARLAEDVCRHYPQVNKPLLLAGTLLHDLGKTSELSGPVGTQYTVKGNLLGHIVIMDAEIVSACAPLKIDPDDEDILLLRHLVVAHHGLNEYGSPKRPQLLEAEILHDLDELDATINMIVKAENKVQPGQFTERIFGLDNRRFYVPKRNNSQTAPPTQTNLNL